MGVSDFVSRMTGYARSAASQYTVKSAMSPIIWICGITSPIFLSAAYAFKDKDNLSFFLVIVGTIPLIIACGMFVYFGMKDPDRLHSEEYRLRDRVLTLTETKGGKIAVNPVELIEVANPFPDVKALEHKRGGAEADSGDESEEENNG